MKLCSNCKRILTLDDFHIKGSSVQSKCKDCCKKYRRQNYLLHRSEILSYTKKDRAQRVSIARTNMLEYLRLHPCIDCGEEDPIVLHCDHLGNKKKEVSRMITNGTSWDKILVELAKCEVRCANCHIRRTAKQFNWYRYSMRPSSSA